MSTGQTALDHMAAHAPDDGPPLGTRGRDSVHHRAERIARQNTRQRIEPAGNARTLLIRIREDRGLHLAAALLQTDSFEHREIERPLLIFTHVGRTPRSAAGPLAGFPTTPQVLRPRDSVLPKDRLLARAAPIRATTVRE